jgi:amino acid permease
MNDIINIIFSLFDFSSEYNLNKDKKVNLTKKVKRISFLILFLIVLFAILFIYNIDSKN